MLYDNRSSEERRSRELELLQNTLSEVDTSYTWQQIKKLIQDCVFPQCEKFGTWSSSGERVDRIPNRKHRKKNLQYLVLRELGRARKRGSSPEQESTTLEPHNSFSAWSSKREKRE